MNRLTDYLKLINDQTFTGGAGFTDADINAIPPTKIQGYIDALEMLKTATNARALKKTYPETEYDYNNLILPLQTSFTDPTDKENKINAVIAKLKAKLPGKRVLPPTPKVPCNLAVGNRVTVKKLIGTEKGTVTEVVKCDSVRASENQYKVRIDGETASKVITQDKLTLLDETASEERLRTESRVATERRRQELARQELARQELARQEAARQEAQRRAREAATQIPPTQQVAEKVEDYYSSGDAEINLFKVFVYRTQGTNDLLLANSTAYRTSTVKSILDGVKGANPNMRCLVSSGKQFVTSLEPKDYYTTFHNLHLKHDQVELFLI